MTRFFVVLRMTVEVLSLALEPVIPSTTLRAGSELVSGSNQLSSFLLLVSKIPACAGMTKVLSLTLITRHFHTPNTSSPA